MLVEGFAKDIFNSEMGREIGKAVFLYRHKCPSCDAVSSGKIMGISPYANQE